MVSAKPTNERIATAIIRISETPMTVVIQPGVAIPINFRTIAVIDAKTQTATRPDAAKIMRVSALSIKVDTAPKPSVMSEMKFIRD